MSDTGDDVTQTLDSRNPPNSLEDAILDVLRAAKPVSASPIPDLKQLIEKYQQLPRSQSAIPTAGLERGEKVAFGNYELLEEIARGGMGVVYKARQIQLRRIVALKMILSGQFAGKEGVQRFRAEAEAAAQLDHPGIVPVFEVGEHEGFHYYSMGFVDGFPLSKTLSEGPLAPQTAAELLKSITLAVQYAHSKGVIHRDLKPGNILLDPAGQPKITDFGLAKRTQHPGEVELTSTGQILGTPSYMPPEQAIGNTAVAREPADVYSLGAVLYAMLVAKPPFQAAHALDTLRMVLEREPVPPRQLNPAIPVDLETICLKCLEKIPARRYESAQSLADELDRFLRGLPILARPIGPLTRGWRWCLRNRAVAILLGLMFLVLIAGTVVSSYFAVNEAFARHEADERKKDAQNSARLANVEAANLALNQAEARCEAGDANIGLLWMVKAHQLARQADDHALEDACRAMISGWLPQVPKLEAVPLEAIRPAARFGSSGEILTLGEVTGGVSSLQVFASDTGERIREVPGVWRPFVSGIPIDRAATKILARDDDKRIRIWSLTENRWIGEPLAVDGELHSADFSPDAQQLVTSSKTGTVEFWDGITGARRPTDFNQPQSDAPYACAVRFARDGKSVWVAGTGRKLGQYGIANGQLLQPLLPLNDAGWSLGVSPTQPVVVVGTMFRGLEFFQVDSQPARRTASEPSLHNYELSFQQDGQYLLAAGRGKHNGARFWRMQDRQPVGAWILAPTSVIGAQLSPSGDRALLCTTNAVEVWRRPAALTPMPQAPLQAAFIDFASYCQQGKLLVTGFEGDRKHIAVHHLDGSKPSSEIGPLPAPLTFLEANENGSHAVGVTTEGHVIFADLRAKEFRVGVERAEGTPAAIQLSPTLHEACIVLARDENRQRKHFVELWNVMDGKRIEFEPKVGPVMGRRSAVFDHSGQLLLILSEGLLHQVTIPTGGVHSQPIPLGPGILSCVRKLADGHRVLIGRGNNLELWDLTKRSKVKTLGGHDTVIANITFSPNGLLAATQGDDRTIRIWDLQRLEMIGTPLRNVGSVTAVAFSADGRLLAVHSREMEIRLFHVPTGRTVSPPLEHTSNNSDHYLTFLDDTHDLFAGHLDRRGNHAVHRYQEVPTEHADLKRLVETHTGLSLQNQDVRVLPRDEWRKQR